MAKTIKQIADELGVSKQAVRNKIANLGLSDKVETTANRIMVNEKQERLIKSAFSRNESQTANRKSVSENSESFRLVADMFSAMEKQLEAKDQQIAELQSELEKEREHNRQKDQQLMEALSALSVGQAADKQKQLADKLIEGQRLVSSTDPAEPKKKKRWWQR